MSLSGNIFFFLNSKRKNPGGYANSISGAVKQYRVPCGGSRLC